MVSRSGNTRRKEEAIDEPVVVKISAKNANVHGEAPATAPGTAKILAVDDDEANLIALRAILSDLGQPIVCARSGQEALRLLLNDDFAVILLDVRMPGMDGYETASFIRGRKHTSHLPIIFLSAVDQDDTHLFRGYAAGAVDYVFKPIEPTVLRAKVSVFIELHEKALEIQRKAEKEKRLLEENLKVRAEQLETAEALKRSLAQQSLVIDSLPISLFVASPDDCFGSRQFVGGNLGALLGLSEDEIAEVQRDWMCRIHEGDRDRIKAAFANLEPNGSVMNEYRFRLDSGERWFIERASLIGVPGEGEQEIVGFLFDDTKRKQMESQLAHVQKMEAIGRMTGSIAHDFNNMLGVIIGSLDWAMKKEELTPKLEKRIDLAMQAAMSCSDLAKRLLGFGRREVLDIQDLNLLAELDRLVPMFERILSGEVNLSIECSPDIWPVRIDKSQLEAALLNLAINARDAMPDGGDLTFRARNLGPADLPVHVNLEEGDYVELTVVDTGSGMTPEVRARALEPFYTTKGEGKGTGLGLSSIYDFIRRSGGGLDIESEPGKGTAIRIFIPKAA